MADWKYYAKWVGGITAAGLVLDNFTGAEGLAATGFSGVSNLSTSLRTGKSTATKPATS